MQIWTDQPKVIREHGLNCAYCAATAGLSYTCSILKKNKKIKKKSPAAAQKHPCEQEMAPQSMNAPLSKVAP